MTDLLLLFFFQFSSFPMNFKKRNIVETRFSILFLLYTLAYWILSSPERKWPRLLR